MTRKSSTSDGHERPDHAAGAPGTTGSSKAQDGQFPIVGMGASAGGLAAFKDFFQSMPPETGMAFVLVQHLDPTHESLMADLLSRHTGMNVVQVQDNMKVEVNHVYVIPPNRDLAIRSGAFQLVKPQQRRGMRMPIDFFFNSLAEDQRERAICIILSGTGSDGTLGLKAVKSYGGMVVTQAPEEAQYDGMPSSAIATGVVDYILPAGGMASVLVNYVKHSYIRGQFGTEAVEIGKHDDFNSILAIMHAQLGHNFHFYKKAMLVRRIKRRMGLQQVEDMGEYVAHIRNNPEETKELFKDCLIGVTGFFREPESWDNLNQLVLANLVAAKSAEQPIRVWVPGCSSGEEAYTVAILLHERLNAMRLRTDFNIFATDIDSNALEFARIGRYPESVASDIPEEYLDKYFTREDGFYQVSGKLRENLVFSAQNLISDPPFSKLDLVTCRNLLIYLDSGIQRKVIELFHFALGRSGYLMLGNSETIGSSGHLFEPISKKWRIYKRLETSLPARANFPILPERRPWGRIYDPQSIDRPKPTAKPGDVIRDALLAKYAPTAVLITRSHDILYHYGDTGRYLQFAPGEHTSDIFSLAREGLITRLRGAVHKAIRDHQAVTVAGARLKRDGHYHPVGFSVAPLKEVKDVEGLYLVTFQDESPKSAAPVLSEPSLEEETVLKQLEHELTSTREELQNTIEELETSNEELKASNEEVMSMNEELQSSNEELETSKEELQSLNEELNTVNSELQEKVRSLEDTNNDITNLVNSTNIAAIFLDTRFTIKFYTPTAKELFNLISTDIGRPLKHVTTRFDDPALLADTASVLDTLAISSAFVLTEDGDWFARKIYPYRTQDGRIDGIVLTFDNVSDLMRTQDLLAKENQKYADAQAMARLGTWEYDIPGDRAEYSDEVFEIFGTDRRDFGGSCADFLALLHPADREKIETAYKESIADRSLLRADYRILRPDSEIRFINVLARTEYDRKGNPLRSSGTIQDITGIRTIEARLNLLHAAIENSEHGYDIVGESGTFLYVNDAYLRMWGYDSKEEVLGTSPAAHCADPTMPGQIIRTVDEHGSGDFEFKARRKDGSDFDVRMKVSSHTGTDGTRHYHGFSEDITRLKQAERQLQTSEEMFRQVFTTIDRGIVVYTAVDDGSTFIIEDMNPAAERAARVSVADVIGREVSEVFPGIAASGLLGVMREVWATGDSREIGPAEYRDDNVHGYFRNSVQRLGSGKLLVVFHEDGPAVSGN